MFNEQDTFARISSMGGLSLFSDYLTCRAFLEKGGIQLNLSMYTANIFAIIAVIIRVQWTQE